MKYLIVLALMVFGLSLSAQPVYVWSANLANAITVNSTGYTDTTITAVVLWETVPDSTFRGITVSYDSDGEVQNQTFTQVFTKAVILRYANRQINQANDETQFLFKEYQAVIDKKNYWTEVKDQIE